MPSTYAWIITRDLTNESGAANAVGAVGPSDASDELVAQLKLGVAGKLPVPHTCEEFRMFDQDMNLLCVGFAIGKGRSNREPLEEFGLPTTESAILYYLCGRTSRWKRAT